MAQGVDVPTVGVGDFLQRPLSYRPMWLEQLNMDAMAVLAIIRNEAQNVGLEVEVDDVDHGLSERPGCGRGGSAGGRGGLGYGGGFGFAISPFALHPRCTVRASGNGTRTVMASGLSLMTSANPEGGGMGSPSSAMPSTCTASASPARSSASSRLRAAVTAPGKSGNEMP